MIREEAKEILEEVKVIDDSMYQYNAKYLEALEMAIKALEQEPKTGHWSHDGSHWENRWICSECGYKLFDEQTNYCPNCGADMRE